VKTQAIIPAAGTGTRLNTDIPKPFVELCGQPLCVYTLQAFERSAAVASVILVGHAERLSELKRIVARYGLKKVVRVVAGGATRRESVSRGLDVLDTDTEIVVVHDGARPLVSARTVDDAVELTRRWGAVITAVPVKSTIKMVDSHGLSVAKTLDRGGLWEVQTPQVFKKDILLRAHASSTDMGPTDDAMMVEGLGIKVKVLRGDYQNIKITTQEDIVVAEAFLKRRDGLNGYGSTGRDRL
jgi:2-C-methyl-D-erythritol 4-phosphate cytidylyltransferase